VNELGNWVVKFQMDHAQSPAFNGMAVRDYRRTVAWVVDGQALGQATVLARSFGGSFQISGYLTKGSAERIARQLDPG
jgi:preprotein translocase subunit SecD